MLNNMKVLKVGYARTFPLEQFGNEKPFVEIEINEGENPMDALNEAKNIVYQFHEQNLAELKAKHETQITKHPAAKLTVFQEIEKCTTIDELKQWELFANSSKNLDVKLAYSYKLETLSTNEPQ